MFNDCKGIATNNNWVSESSRPGSTTLSPSHRQTETLVCKPIQRVPKASIKFVIQYIIDTSISTIPRIDSLDLPFKLTLFLYVATLLLLRDYGNRNRTFRMLLLLMRGIMMPSHWYNGRTAPVDRLRPIRILAMLLRLVLTYR